MIHVSHFFSLLFFQLIVNIYHNILQDNNNKKKFWIKKIEESVI